MSPIFSRPAISFSALATSSPCARLSSWHGPAMIEIGRSLPNLTDPAATTGAAETVALKAFPSLRRPQTMPRGAGGINPRKVSIGFEAEIRAKYLCRLEYQGCTMGAIRRQDQTPAMAP
jgi:hypothetical protein